MLTRAEAVLLRTFLTAAYAHFGYPEPEVRAEVTVNEIRFMPARLCTVAEVAGLCDSVHCLGGILCAQAEPVRQVLVRLLSRTTDACEGEESSLSADFWRRYHRRYATCEAAAHREAEALRLLDCCDPAFLFDFYDLPEECGLSRHAPGRV
ncbi:MAG: hypothetical protein M5U22_03730 [Thermoleophilia bacterium]|nr:hypothetical protein [Thermoleophilia bacterium]